MTTYSDAVNRARAAYAVGLNKNASGNGPAENAAWNKKVDEEEAGRQHYIDEMNKNVNRAQGEQYVRDQAAEKQRQAEAQAYADDIQAAGEQNLATGQELSKFISSAKTLGRSGGMNMDTAERILLMSATGSLPDDLTDLVPVAQNIVASNYTGKKNEVVNRAQGEQESRDIAQGKADALAAKGRNWGIGAGLAGGAAVGAGAYGLTGLFPSLRKRRLLRALMALTAGGAAGAGIGYGVNKGITSGKIG